MPRSSTAKRLSPKLPPKVHAKGPSLYYVHKNVWHKLCPADSPELTVYRELARVKEALQREPIGELSALFDEFLREGMPEMELAASTQADYRGAIERRLRRHFGHMRISSLTSAHVAQYLRMRRKQGNAVAGNRERSCLSSVYTWAMSVGKAAHNPCRGVPRNKEKPRTRYVTDEEFLTAFETASEPFQDLLAVALLTGLRQGDLRSMKRTGPQSAVQKDGLRIGQSKDGKHILMSWSEPLWFFVARALQRSEDANSDYLFVHSQRRPWTKNGINAAMQRLGTKWTFHDLRAKAESDHDTGLGLMTRYKRARRLKPVR